MTLPRLRRWYFDIALLVGLLLFGISYRCILPGPKWSSRLPTDPANRISAGNLGFSPDSRFIYTLTDITIIGNHLPKPMIQKWDVQTGKLLAEYPLQIPAEDVAYLKPVSPGGEYLCLQFRLCLKQGVVYSSQDTYYQSREKSYRLYDVATGQCLNAPSQLVLKTHLYYLLQNPADGHHWGCYVNEYQPGERVQLCDITTGKTLYSIPAEKNKTLQNAVSSLDQQYLIIAWGPPNTETMTAPPIMSIYRMGTWELLHEITLPIMPFGLTQLTQMSNEHFIIKFMTREKEITQLVTYEYRYNAKSKAFEPVGQPSIEPWNGNDVTWNQDNLRLHRQTIKDSRQPSELILAINNFLQRYGFSIWRPRTEQQFHVHDLQSDKLLRQLTGITDFGDAILLVSSTGQYVAGVQSSGANNWIREYSLILYEIPHHLWERSLRWTMYLSWLLVLPWPFRYLVRPARTVAVIR